MLACLPACWRDQRKKYSVVFTRTVIFQFKNFPFQSLFGKEKYLKKYVFLTKSLDTQEFFGAKKYIKLAWQNFRRPAFLSCLLDCSCRWKRNPTVRLRKDSVEGKSMGLWRLPLGCPRKPIFEAGPHSRRLLCLHSTPS